MSKKITIFVSKTGYLEKLAVLPSCKNGFCEISTKCVKRNPMSLGCSHLPKYIELFLFTKEDGNFIQFPVNVKKIF